jgi:hypothetical protein
MYDQYLPQIVTAYFLVLIFGISILFLTTIYSETSLNQTLKNQSSQNVCQFFNSLSNNSLQMKSYKTGHPSKAVIFFGPNAGRFREVSLYMLTLVSDLTLRYP